MGRIKSLIALLAACGSLCTVTVTPVSAQMVQREAEQLRRLDIMLMVTSLRCRFGEHDMQPAYGRFTTRHMSVLNQAARAMQARYSRRQMDTVQTTMANQYGQGHPWLDCAGLLQRTEELAQQRTRVELLAAADELLASAPPQRSTLVARYEQ